MGVVVPLHRGKKKKKNTLLSKGTEIKYQNCEVVRTTTKHICK
jgi:hypothetical protein